MEASAGQLGLAFKKLDEDTQQSQVVLPLKLTQPQVLVFTETFCAVTAVMLL